MSLRVNVEKKDGGVYIFTITGSIDTDTFKILADKVTPLLVTNTRVIIFDMDGVEYVSSMGMNTIFRTQRILEQSGGTFVMTNVQRQVKKVFEVVEALPNVKVFENMEEADAYLFKIQREEIEKKHSPPEK